MKSDACSAGGSDPTSERRGERAEIRRRSVYRGGNWNNGGNAGVFYLNGTNDRSNANDNIGFRSAYIPEIG